MGKPKLYRGVDISTISWKLWYRDKFDRECPRKCEDSGTEGLSGLKSLWLKSLAEGLKIANRHEGDGVWSQIPTASFSDFQLEWVIGERSEMIWVPITSNESPVNQTLLRLKNWMFAKSDQNGLSDSEVQQIRSMLISQLHLSELGKHADHQTASAYLIKQLDTVEDFSNLFECAQDLLNNDLDFTPE